MTTGPFMHNILVQFNPKRMVNTLRMDRWESNLDLDDYYIKKTKENRIIVKKKMKFQLINATMQVMSSITSSSFYHAFTASLVSLSTAPSQSFFI